MRGDRLQSLRQKRGLSQRALAKQCGFGEKQIYRYESGESDPSGEHIARMARELSVTADYLLGLSDDPLPYASRGDLTAMQRELLTAWESGDFAELFSKLSEKARGQELRKPGVPRKKPRMDS